MRILKLVLIGVSVVTAIATATPAHAMKSKFNTSWYQCCNPTTASGMSFNPDNPHIVAHKTYRFGKRFLLTNHENGNTVCVVVEDRGPYVDGREFDVTRGGKKRLGFSGLANVSAKETNCPIPKEFLNPKRP